MKKQLTNLLAGLVFTTSAFAAAAPANPKVAGDVIGNKGFWYISGHVGIWDGKYPVEVQDDKLGVNKTCVHFVNSSPTPTNGKPTTGRTLDDFKKGGYWGARYDSSITSSKLLQVIESLKSQAYSYKASYSLAIPGLKFRTSTKYAWYFNGNTLEYKQLTGDAKLRCDFAVAMAFKEKAGKNLFTSTLKPSVVYDNMPKAR